MNDCCQRDRGEGEIGAGGTVRLLVETADEETDAGGERGEPDDARCSQVGETIPGDEDHGRNHEGPAPVDRSIAGAETEEVIRPQCERIQIDEDDSEHGDTFGGRGERLSSQERCDGEGRNGHCRDDERSGEDAVVDEGIHEEEDRGDGEQRDADDDQDDLHARAPWSRWRGCSDGGGCRGNGGRSDDTARGGRGHADRSLHGRGGRRGFELLCRAPRGLETDATDQVEAAIEESRGIRRQDGQFSSGRMGEIELADLAYGVAPGSEAGRALRRAREVVRGSRKDDPSRVLPEVGLGFGHCYVSP